MKGKRKRIWKKAGRYWFCYIGHRKWWSPHTKGRIYYRQKDGSFFSPAPKNNGGLKGLKSWWKKRAKSKGYNFHGATKKYHNKGRFDWLTYWRERR